MDPAPATLTVLGSGNAFHQDGRLSQALLVQRARGAPYLVDAGPSAAAALRAHAPEAAPPDRLFVTHLHGDHVFGWPFLLLQMALEERRERPFRVIGPAGTRESLTALARAAYGDLLDRPPFPLSWTELPVERGALELDDDGGGPGLRVETVPMAHHPTSLGYRFSDGGGGPVLAISGDTAWCDGLEALARGADRLAVECTSDEPLGAPHVALDELREKRARLEAPHVLLVHLCDEVATSLARDPLPGVDAAWDGLRWPLSG